MSAHKTADATVADRAASERPDLAAWRQRHELRRSSAAQPIPSGKRYARRTKNDRDEERRDGWRR